jgi:hypothetical protein
MNAKDLAKKASSSTTPYIDVLSDKVCHQLELAFVAQWLHNQHEGCRGESAVIACEAISTLQNAHIRTSTKNSAA